MLGFTFVTPRRQPAADHVEREYYERFFVNGLTEVHRRHAELWG